MLRPPHVGDSNISYEQHWKLLTEILRTRGMIALPNTYLVLDIETTAVTPASGSIIQLGWVQVIDGVIKSRGGLFISAPEAELQAYENSSYVKQKISEGNTGYVKAADVREHGIPRVQAFSLLHELYSKTMANFAGSIVIGHNLTGFDIPFIEYHSQKEGRAIKFDRTRVFDTGVAFKANKLGLLPRDDEPIWEFFCRVREIRAAGVYWRLEIAVKELGLESVINNFLLNCNSETPDEIMYHDASTDTLATHFIYQELRAKKLVG